MVIFPSDVLFGEEVGWVLLLFLVVGGFFSVILQSER